MAQYFLTFRLPRFTFNTLLSPLLKTKTESFYFIETILFKLTNDVHLPKSNQLLLTSLNLLIGFTVIVRWKHSPFLASVPQHFHSASCPGLFLSFCYHLLLHRCWAAFGSKGWVLQCSIFHFSPIVLSWMKSCCSHNLKIQADIPQMDISCSEVHSNSAPISSSLRYCTCLSNWLLRHNVSKSLISPQLFFSPKGSLFVCFSYFYAAQ